MRNKTYDMIIIYDKTLNYYLNNNNLRRIEEVDLQYRREKWNFCFIKIEFYRNGEIKNYYLPEGFKYSNFIIIDNLIKLIITKISPNLYVEDINKALNEVISSSNNETDDTKNEISHDKIEDLENSDNETDINEIDINEIDINQIDINEIDSNEEYIRRNLKQNNNKKYKKYKLSSVYHKYSSNTYKRKLTNITNDTVNDTVNDTLNNTTYYYIDDVDIEKYNSPPLINSTNIDFRETNNINNSNSNIQNYSNLTQFSIDTIENYEGSQVNQTTSLIDKNGILEYVEEITTTSMNPLEDDDEEDTLLKREIYNTTNNQISMEDIREKDDELLKKYN